MRKIVDKRLYRIIDANFNRAKEGLRVCEDVCRFLYNKRNLTQRYKHIRHRLTVIISQLSVPAIINARDIVGDVGKKTSFEEFKRSNVNDIFYANSQRVKESLRVLEEFTKLADVKLSEGIKTLRYQIYEAERAVVKSLHKNFRRSGKG